MGLVASFRRGFYVQAWFAQCPLPSRSLGCFREAFFEQSELACAAAPLSLSILTMKFLVAFIFLAGQVTLLAQQWQSVTFTNSSGLSLKAVLCQPVNTLSPAVAVVVMHGSGGMWRNDDAAAGVMNPNFREWATNLTAAGYVALFVDSYTPRGLVEFKSKRPAENQAVDDAACSPAYERPKDAHAALRYLRTLPGIRGDRIGLVAFSQGAESALSAVLDRTLNRAWTSSYLLTNGVSTNKPMPAPPRLEPGEQGFAVALCFYPGCGFFNYYGSPSLALPGLYIPETPTLIFHGSADPLYSDNLYPERFTAKAKEEAVVRGLRMNPLGLLVFNGAAHSFDEESLSDNPVDDTPSQRAKREGRAIAMDWLRTHLHNLVITQSRTALQWTANQNTRYELVTSSNLELWDYSPIDNTGHYPIMHAGASSHFYQMRASGIQLESLPKLNP